MKTLKTSLQKIEVYETVPFGKMLVIDGIIMLTQYDNFAYHEMIAHVPMNAHPNPQKILIVGGGDGGTLKEILKYSSVQEVIVCEIDKEVIKISKKYFPELASSFDDPRVLIVNEDAAKFIKTNNNYFDVICVDSSDPIGPAEVLFTKKFYQDLSCALTADGIAVTQSESMFYSLDLIEELYTNNKGIFKHAFYYYTVIPTYPSGTIGFSFCSKKYDPFELLDSSKIAQLQDLRYYDEAIHKASFQLPVFVQRKLGI